MLEQLIEKFQNWCAEQGLPGMSADELVWEEGIAQDQKTWLLNFIDEWEAAEELV